MHCLEVRNLMEVGELVLMASLERKESRRNFTRPDYPFTNPMLDDKQLICRKVGDRAALEWNEVKS